MGGSKDPRPDSLRLLNVSVLPEEFASLSVWRGIKLAWGGPWRKQVGEGVKFGERRQAAKVNQWMLTKSADCPLAKVR